MGCDNEPELSVFFGVAGGLWSLFTLGWIVNTWIINKRHTKPLHKLICFVLVFRSLYDIFLSCFLITCSDSPAGAYWALATTTSYTLYNTFVFTTFVLISKGFCVTRDMLDRSEVTVVAMTMGAVYLGFSAFMIEPTQLGLLLVIMLFALFYLTIKFTLSNIKALQTHLMNLMNSNIQAMLPPVWKKLKMLRWFFYLAQFFYIQKLFILLVLGLIIPLIVSVHWEYRFTTNVLDETWEIIVLFWIFIVFRSKNQGQFFNIHVMGMNSQITPIAPFLQARLPESFSVELSSVNQDRPVIVQPPSEFDRENPYHRLMVATCMTSE